MTEGKRQQQKPQRKRFGETRTQKVVLYLLIVGIINGTAPYILSAFGRDPVTEIGVAWITSIVAVALAYFIRGYKDTKSEEDLKFRRERFMASRGETTNDDTENGGGAAG